MQQVRPTTDPGVTPWGDPVSPKPADPTDEPDVPAPVGLIFPSRSGGAPHVVIVVDIGALVCTCPAMRSIESRPAGCWAMKEARRLLGVSDHR